MDLVYRLVVAILVPVEYGEHYLLVESKLSMSFSAQWCFCLLNGGWWFELLDAFFGLQFAPDLVKWVEMMIC